MTRVPEGRWNEEPHDAQFRILIHAVHRHSFQHFLLPAIDKSETYKHNHLMSDEWADDSGPDANEVGSTNGEFNDGNSENYESAGDGHPESSEWFAEPGARDQYLKAVKA
ncbi:hypothetical protein N7G274_001207 [Stereocaulon virgatum]|uniref:Uncharacterized protein n=1 Tax=Stereocaulon virgatum TaxID=373712 RepID=A0ABR4AN70_9LECA